MEHDINLDVEVNELVECIDDHVDSAVEDFMVRFAERQYGDWVNTHGVTAASAGAFSDLEDEILRRALRVIRTRWERSGN